MGIKSQFFKYFFPEVISAKAIRRISSDSGVVLMYHEVLPDEINIPAWTVVRESDFYWQMRYLQKHYDVVPLDEALERVNGRHEAGKPFAVVSFDDGYKGNLNHVLPVMETIGLPFIVYVATRAVLENNLFWFDRIIKLLVLSEDIHVELTSRKKSERFMIPGKAHEILRWQAVQKLLVRLKKMTIDEREYWVCRIAEHYAAADPVFEMLNADDLQALSSSSLVTIGSHTHGHELLDQLDAGSIIETLQTSKRHIKNITGVTPEHFSYPNGNYNQSILGLVQNNGFKTAVTTESNLWFSKNGLMEIPRIGVGRFETKNRFRAKVSGFLL